MRVTILGPNLTAAAQRRGDMHVHAAGCADIRQYGRGRRYGGEDRGWTIEADSRRAVIEAIYPPDEFDYDPETELDGFASDVYFAPCVELGEA